MGPTIDTTFCVTDPRVREKLWAMYDAAHGVSDEKAIQQQRCFTEAHFLEVLADRDYVKFVLFENGEPAGIIGGTRNLEKARVAYVNPQRLTAAHRPNGTETRELWYMPILAVRPDHQGRRHSTAMFEAMTAFFLMRGADFASDYANDKHPRFVEYVNAQVDRALAGFGGPDRHVTAQELGGQTYVIWRLP